MAGICILSIVIRKLSHWQEAYQIIFVKIDKNLEVRFYYITLMFDLTVDLQIEENEKFLFDTKKIRN